jgi:hypothetical protein
LSRRLRKRRRKNQKLRRGRYRFQKNPAEEIVCLILKEFLENSLIMRWRRSRRYGEEDIDGIDFFVAIDPYRVVVFQVKMIPDESENVLIKNFFRKYPHFRGNGKGYKELVLARHFHYHPHIGRVVFLEEKDLKTFSGNQVVEQKVTEQIRKVVFENSK